MEAVTASPRLSEQALAAAGQALQRRAAAALRQATEARAIEEAGGGSGWRALAASQAAQAAAEHRQRVYAANCIASAFSAHRFAEWDAVLAKRRAAWQAAQARPVSA